jgi:ABC-2 type transport system permease protein
VLAKLERAAPDVTVRLAEALLSSRSSANDEHYGEVVYVYGPRTDTSRSTSHREVLPLIYALADRAPPAPVSAPDYPGYPLMTRTEPALVWFFGALPLLILLAWWLSRRPPDVRSLSKMEKVHEHA